MTTYVRGEVTGIASETEVVLLLDRPEKAGKGMLFIVYEEGQTIHDGQGHRLGTLELQKARIRLTHVQPDFAFAESAEVTKIWRGPTPEDALIDIYEEQLEAELYEIRTRPIASKPEAQQGPTDKSGEPIASLKELTRARLKNKTVVVGDLVRSVLPIRGD